VSAESGIKGYFRGIDYSRVSDAWERGDPYEQYVGRWSRRIAPPFLSWLGIAAGKRWLDVGCGTGALCASILDHCSPLSVIGVDPSEGFLEKAKEHLGNGALLQRGSAMEISLGDASIDVAVSGLVLNFIPNQRAALSEMARVTASGGTIAAYVWDYAGKMELMRFFWDAAVELHPDAIVMDEGVRFPICHPTALADLFASSGLRGVEVTSIDVPTPFRDFEDYWRPFLGGQGPAPAYAMALDETDRARLRDRIRSRIPLREDGSICLIARSWAVRGTTV
jgi:SAM-dependent methyltransferase